ncbi:MAG: PAS domain S-box protein [Acidobacteriota bacterium]
MSKTGSAMALRYGGAATYVVLAALIRWLLGPVLHENIPFLTLFAAVVWTSWRSGLGPALFAAALGAVAAATLFMPPVAAMRPSDLVGAGLYGVVSIGSALLISAHRSARHRAEEATRQANLQSEWLNVAMMSVGAGVIITDASGHVTFLNPVAQFLTGWTEHEAQRQPLHQVFRILDEATQQPIDDSFNRVLALGVIFGFAPHTTLLARDGSQSSIQENAAPIRDPEGNTVGIIVVFQDVGERRRTQKAIEESEARKTAIVETALDCIITMDHEGKIVEFNPAAERTFGYSRAQAVGRLLSDTIVPPAMRQSHAHGLARYLATGEGPVLSKRIEITAMRSDQTEFPIELAITRIPVTGPPLFTAYLRDITARREAESQRARLLEAERAARTAAELAGQAKDDFLGVVSHELRTPLNSILGWVHILQQGLGSSEEHAHGLEVIERSARAQAHLIDDLLDVSRIAAGKLVLQLRATRLAPLLHDAVAAVSPAAKARQIRLTVDAQAPDQVVRADPDRLLQILSNLLSNAVKFTPVDGSVEVRQESVGTQAVVSVTDTGIGIAPEFLAEVFAPFQQVDASSSRQYGGLGLGLAISQQIVGLHGGTIEARSPGLGKGATFIVRLPLAVQVSDAVEKGNERAQPAAVGSLGLGAEHALNGLRVMVVEDHRDSGDMLMMSLTQFGAIAMLAESAPEAIELLAGFNPDVIVADIGLPGEDGFSLIRQIRAMAPPLGKIPAIALTGFAKFEDRNHALNSGFQEYLVKPLTPTDLCRAIARISKDEGRKAKD